LESVDLPPQAIGGEYVSIKVGIGKREFQTRPSETNGGKTAAWNSNFAFPVLNLRDNLIVALLDSKGNAISQTEIGTPIIVEKGSLDELFPLKGGGCVHLRLSFVLTLEERIRIEAMRDAALKKQHKNVKKNATSQVPNPAEENKGSALASGTIISQTIAEEGKAKNESHNEKNQITTIVFPQASLPNEMQKKTESTEGLSVAPISSPIQHVTDNDALSNGLKDISDQDLKEYGYQHLPQHNLEEAILSNDIQKKTGSIKEASFSPASLPIENFTHKDVSSHDLKDISVQDIKEAASTVPSKKLTLPKDSSLLPSNMLFPKIQGEELMQANTLFVNEQRLPAQLHHVKDGLAESRNSYTRTSLDKFSMFGLEQKEIVKNDTTLLLADPVSEVPSSTELSSPKHSSVLSSNMSPSKFQGEDTRQANVPFANENLMPALLHHGQESLAEWENSDANNPTDNFLLIGPGQTKFGRKDITSILADSMVVSEIPSHQALVTIHETGETHAPGSSLHQENRNLSTASPGYRPVEDFSDGQSSANLDTQFATGGGSSGMPPSTEEGITTSSLSTYLSELPLQYSKDGSNSLTPLVDSPGDTIDIIMARHSASDFCTSMDRTSSAVVNAENTEVFTQDICLVQSDTINSPDIVLQSDTGNGSLSGKESEGVCQASSLQTVQHQSLSTAKCLTKSVLSNIPKLIDNHVHTVVSTSFPNPLASHTIIGDGRQSGVKAKIKVFETTLSSQTMKGVRQSGVKAKIKAFESSLSQDPDYRTSTPLKTNHKIEAERARQRLWAEAASAEAAEARRQAEEEEAKLKSITEGREGKMGFQQKQESRFTRPVKLKRKYLERNEEGDKRQPQKDVKNITVFEDVIGTHDAHRGKEEVIQKACENRPEIAERNRKREDMGALRKHLKEQAQNQLKAIETKEKTTEEDPRQKTVNWERMRLGELQLKRNLQDATVKSNLSAKENVVVEKSIMDESTKASWSRRTSEQKQDAGVQVGQSQLRKYKARRSAAEARPSANEKEKQMQGNNHYLTIDQRVHSMTTDKSSDEEILAEEDATISEEKHEDLVNGSTTFGGFIKQALGVAALFAAGALFMWLRGETLNRRRLRMAQHHNQHYFLPNGEAARRILEGEFGSPNSRILNVNSE
ncbi:hypothetical protein KI387_007385, partial [Taxus chinensis]